MSTFSESPKGSSNNSGKDKGPNATVICDYSDRKKYPVTASCYLAITLWVGWFILLPVIFIITYLFYRHGYNKAFGTIAGLIVLSMVYPISESYRPKWGARWGEWIMEQACIYFGLRLVQEEAEALKKVGPIIIAIEPHDVLPVCIFAFSEILGFFPGQKGRGCLASACFRVPFMRQSWAWANAQSVDRSNMKRLMSLGFSPGICPGGAAEVTVLDDPDEYILNLRSRKGMFKLAMETGHAVVPVFAFGQRKAYKWIVPIGGDLKKKIASSFGFIPIMFFGAFNIPLFIPKSVPITVVTGVPIVISKYGPEPDKKSNPDLHKKYEELVNKYMDQWIQGVERIFETYKDKYGCETATLKII